MVRSIGKGGVALLHKWEQGPHGGPALTWYKDSAGFDTIGWGHKRRPGDPWSEITPELAEMILVNDRSPAEAAVSQHVYQPLNQNQYDALVCFAFNVGCFNFVISSLVDLLNDGHYDAVPGQLLLWDHARDPVTHREVVVSGLLNRRKAEVDLWSTPE
jgi:lysozyme